jgi:hypothetical protein
VGSKTKSFWLEHLRLLDESKLSLAEYARRQNLSSKSLYNYRHKVKRRLVVPTRLPDSKPAASFVQVRVSEPALPDLAVRCALVLSTGHRLEMNRLPEPQWLLALTSDAREIR